MVRLTFDSPTVVEGMGVERWGSVAAEVVVARRWALAGVVAALLTWRAAATRSSSS